MTPQELKSEMSHLGLSVPALAMALGYDRRTVQRYLGGQVPIPRWLRGFLQSLHGGVK